jgi:hypothetical protein
LKEEKLCIGVYWENSWGANDLDLSDYPDYVDAFLVGGQYKNKKLTKKDRKY